MNKTLTAIVSFTGLLIIRGSAFGGSQADAGLTVLESPSARAAALGEAFSTVPNDVTAFIYNPAALDSLRRDHASFLYQEGINDDSFGQLTVGHPMDRGSLGLSVGYYDGGDATVYDGISERTVKTQQDLNVTLGGAIDYGSMDVGANLKYISSRLGETASAATMAADVGAVWPNKSAFRLGAALQNIGGSLKYVDREFDMPRIARFGASYQMMKRFMSPTLLVDVPYHMNQQEFRPGLGIEAMAGPLALRAGYRRGASDLEEFTLGTGFLFGSTTLDYSFGMVDKFNSRHRISVAFKFGRIIPRWSSIPDKMIFSYPANDIGSMVEQARQENLSVKETVVTYTATVPPMTVSVPNSNVAAVPQRQNIYLVQPGETLKSIAKQHLGYEGAWDQILRANQHLGLDPEHLVPGEKILIPERNR